MIEFYKPIVEAATASAKKGGDPFVILRDLPISVFGRLLVQPNVEYPPLVEYLPKVPAVDIQTKYNGRANLELLSSSVSFLESVSNAYTQIYNKKFPVGGKVLDYGFGWGRLIRMSYWLTNPDDIYGFDPLQGSIDICKSCDIKANLQLCDELPKSLPIERDFFDLAYSFSVFTHLSFKAADRILKTLHKHIKRDGMLTITIRPVEFWDYFKSVGRITDEEYKSLLDQHHNKGFAYIPLKGGWKAVDGEVHFGDTSMTLDFIKSAWPEWKVVQTNLTLEDPYQLHVFLVPN